jgi:hypothetical protein
MGQCRSFRADLAHLPTEARVRHVSAALAPVVGRMPSSPCDGPHDGGCDVLRANSEDHPRRCSVRHTWWSPRWWYRTASPTSPSAEVWLLL